MTNSGIAAGTYSDCLGKQAAAFGTLLNWLIPPRAGKYTRISKMVATAAGTAHTLTVLRGLGTTTCVGANASGQAVVNITADPGVATINGVAYSNAIAANDIVAIKEKDGITRQYKVSSVSSLAITLTSNLVAGTVGGESFWFFGVIGDTDPRTGAAHQTFTVPASATTAIDSANTGIAVSNNAGEPLIVQDNNITATGTLEYCGFVYTPN